MSPASHRFGALVSRACVLGLAAALVGFTPVVASAQGNGASARILTSRAELDSMAATAERAALKGEDRERNQQVAASIRERLREGDFQIGDRVAVTVQIDSIHTDTLLVRSGRVLILPNGPPPLQLAGVLRSEIQPLVKDEILKYVKARRVDAIPLMRVAIVGEVARPNFYDFVYDAPITTALMAAGGPNAMADLSRSVLRRDGKEVHSSTEVSRAIDRGLTLDKFGMQAGDELVIGRRKEFNFTQIFTYTSALAGLVTVYVALHNAQRAGR
jgi:hypothetical protein